MFWIRSLFPLMDLRSNLESLPRLSDDLFGGKFQEVMQAEAKRIKAMDKINLNQVKGATLVWLEVAVERLRASRSSCKLLKLCLKSIRLFFQARYNCWTKSGFWVADPR